ncbi:MAG: hypothetical protein WDM78_06135 [Puia sp.]
MPGRVEVSILAVLWAEYIAISTSFKSKPKDTKKAEEQKKETEGMLPMTLDEQQAELDYIRQNPAEFADFNVSWSVNVSFAFSFTNSFVSTSTGGRFVTQIASSLILNGDFNLTEKWKMGYNIYYDIKNRTLNNLTTFLSRDMHCWQLSINVTARWLLSIL